MNYAFNPYLLRQFFACEFNEDWPREAEDSDGIIKLYMEHAKIADRVVLSRHLLDYVDHYASDDDLIFQNRLYRELECYYMPLIDGISPKDWVRQVASQIIAE